MAITGINVDRQVVTPRLEALMNLKKTAKFQGMLASQTLSVSGLTVTLGYSYGHIQGFYFEIADSTSLSIAPSTSGYICARLDLSQTNTATGSIADGSYSVDTKQLSLVMVPKANIKKDQIHGNGTFVGAQRDLVLYSYTANATTAVVTPFAPNWIYDGGAFNPVKSYPPNTNTTSAAPVRGFIRNNVFYMSGEIEIPSAAVEGRNMFFLNDGLIPDPKVNPYHGTFPSRFRSNLDTQSATIYVYPDGHGTLQAFNTTGSGTTILAMDSIVFTLPNDDTYFYPS